MSDLRKVEFFLAMNSCGEVQMDVDSASDALTGLIDNYGGYEAVAVYHLVAMVPCPEPVTIKCGTFPAATNPVLSVTAAETAPE